MRRTIALVEKTNLDKALEMALPVPDTAISTVPVSALQSGVRCKACQLQLCKGRGERPHAALVANAVAQVSGRDSSRGTADTSFVCKTCGITMINSTDLSRPGWRQAR